MSLRYLLMPSRAYRCSASPGWLVIPPDASRTPGVQYATPHAVALFFWGREVTQWIVYDAEVPYRFLTEDTALIEATLTHFPARGLLRAPPLRDGMVTLGMLQDVGEQGISPQQRHHVICQIGDGRRVPMPYASASKEQTE